MREFFKSLFTPSLKTQRENLQESIKLKNLQGRERRLKESLAFDPWLNTYSQMLDRSRDGMVGQYPISQPTDRRYGSNFPFWVSEAQLSILRAAARFCVTTNANAQGLINGLTSYVVGVGYKYTASAKDNSGVDEITIKKVQGVIDRFTEDNAWCEMEQELFYRSREDGECFVRFFPQASGRLSIRTVEPEMVYQPVGSDQEEWSYGIQTAKDDVCNIKAYYVDYRSPMGMSERTKESMGEVVSASLIAHIKVNVKRSIKRGLTDFSYDTVDAFTSASKLRKNLGEGAAVQAAIAAVRQHETTSAGQITDFIDDTKDFTINSQGRSTDFQRIESGSFLDIPKGMNYIPPPAAVNAAPHMEIFAGLLRSAGNRHNAPEWLVSSDSSNNNFASSLTAEAPFTRQCLRLQEFYKYHFCKVIKFAIKTAADHGQLPENILKLIDIKVDAPAVEAKDRAAEANANQIYSTLGIKSKKTIAEEIGLDYEKETDNIKDDIENGGSPTPVPADPQHNQPARF